MNFIEYLLHISPDGGSGTLEMLLFLAPILVAGVGFLLLKRQQSGSE